MLRYDSQNKISDLHNIPMNLHTFYKFSNILHFTVKFFLILLFFFHVPLCPGPLLFFVILFYMSNYLRAN